MKTYSIIIVAYQASEALQRCIDSLTLNPPAEAAEIIIVDNSPKRLEPLIKDAIEVYKEFTHIWDGRNLGFAEGCNLGASFATGENLVFVNPDTVVFPGWAEGMAKYLREGVGAVGPISNFVAGLQNYFLHMQRTDDWERAARLAMKGMRGRGVDTKLLIGFFLMIPSKVYHAVGGMDKNLFLGCDDLDLSLRLRDMGYTLVIASDIFVYHEGHQSFEAMGIRSAVLNKQAEKYLLEKLRAKYGEGMPTSTELWGCEILPTERPEAMTLSVCMIVRDEGKNLSELLPQLGFANEIVIVDTDPVAYQKSSGLVSSMVDETRQGVFVYSHPWADDFSAARNYALSKCTGDYVLWLDADDRVPAESAALIRAALDNPGPMTQARACHFGFTIRDRGPSGKYNYTMQPRLFPRLPGLKWTGRIHERYAQRAEEMGLKYVIVPGIVLDHTGYENPALLASKLERNLRLLDMEPDTEEKFYHLGKTFQGMRRFPEAKSALMTALNLLPFDAIGARDQVRYQIALLLYQENPATSEEMDSYLLYNSKADALFLRGERAFMTGAWEAASLYYWQYLQKGQIVDIRGTDVDTYREASEARINMINASNCLGPEAIPEILAGLRKKRMEISAA